MNLEHSQDDLLETAKESISKSKMRTALALCFLIVIIICVSSLTSASPISTEESPTSTSESPMLSTIQDVYPTIGVLNNGSKLVITNVVKTVEFDVALEDYSDELSTHDGDTTPAFIETDIKVLDPILLEQVVTALEKSTNVTNKSD